MENQGDTSTRKSDYRNEDEKMVNYFNNITTKLGHYKFEDLDVKFTNTFLTVDDNGVEHFTIEIVLTHACINKDKDKVFKILKEDILPEYMATFYNVKDFKVAIFDDSGKTQEVERIFENNISKKEEAKFKDKVKAIKRSLKQRDKRLSDETAQKSAEKIAGSMIKNESIRDDWKPSIDLYTRQINEIADNLGISKYEVQKEGDAIKFRYNGKVYFAEPRAMYQVDVFDDNHKQIGWGVLTDKIKEEVFTDYITDNKFVYELVGGEYNGTYTKEEAENLPIKENELTDKYDNDEGLRPRKELQGQLKFKGYLGPMWGGIVDGKAVIRYETQEVYDQLSESNELDEIASKVHGTEVEKKPKIEYEYFDTYNDLDDLGSEDELIYDLYEKLGIDIPETWDNVINDMDNGILKIAIINGKRYLVYDDGKTKAYCVGRASDNTPISVIGNIEDDIEIMKPIKRDTTELDNVFKSVYGDDIKLDESESSISENKESLNTGILPVLDVDLYSLDSNGLLPDNVDSYKDLDKIIQDVASPYIEEVVQTVLHSAKVTPTGVYHPREYNFSGDELEFDLTFDQDEYNKLKENTLSNKEFKNFLKDKYSSYSGFISSMPNNMIDFERASSWQQVVQVIMFALRDYDFDQLNEKYLDEFMEAIRDEFGYDFNEELDESKEFDEDEFMFDKYNIRRSLAGYIKYVSDCIDDKEAERWPVCFDEFFDNEYKSGYYNNEDTKFLDKYSIDDLYDMANKYNDYIMECEETGDKIKKFTKFFKLQESYDYEESEEGKCPVCGNEDLDYGSTKIEGDSLGYKWTCSKCKSQGIEWYTMSFSEIVGYTDDGEVSGYEAGLCPRCGSDVDYGTSEPDGMSMVYDFTCPNCGCTGDEYYDLTFDEQEVTYNGKNNGLKESKKLQEDLGKSSFKLYVSPEELFEVNVSSLLFDSNDVIADYQEGNYLLSLLVNGEVRILDTKEDKVYKNYQQFPDDLVQKIKSGELGYQDSDDRYIVDMNNWFEWVFDKFDGDVSDTIWSDVADIEGMLDKSTPTENETELEVIMKDLFDDISRDILGTDEKLQEAEIIDRPEDIQETQEDQVSENSSEDNTDAVEDTTIDELSKRIGQELNVGRLNTILQSIFGMYNRTFILPDDLYNMDLDYTQTLTIEEGEDEYNIYYDIIDVDDGIIKIVDVEVV